MCARCFHQRCRGYVERRRGPEITAKDDGHPVLVKAGLAHVQFETIHPFLDGVREVAEGAFATARNASETIRDDRSRIGRQGRRARSALRVHQSLVEHPVGGIGHLARRTGLSAPTVAAALRLLGELDIVREITGRQRGRVFTYERYLAVLREGTEDSAG